MFEDYNLKNNPFRITPAISEEDLIWAGFSELKVKIEKRVKRSIKIPNSSLILNWGEYGSGKTHAARFFNTNSELTRISESLNSKIPYSIVFALPKGKEPVLDIFTSIVDNIDIDKLREQFSDLTFNLNEDVIEKITKNIVIQNALKAIFDNSVDKSLLKKYLYGSITKTEISKINTDSNLQLLRSLNNDNDYILLMSSLFTCLTYKKEVYSSIILWIDEFEDIQVFNSSNIDKTNNFLREILDFTPNNLLIFINITQSALFGVTDLASYIYESVKSRIKERINFEIPNTEELKKYLLEILRLNRIREQEVNLYHPFEETTINTIIRDLNNASLRSFNEALSLLLELGDMENETPVISETFYDSVKPEIIGWKDD